MDIKPVEPIETQTADDVMAFLETLGTIKKEEDTEDYEELDFN